MTAFEKELYKVENKHNRKIKRHHWKEYEFRFYIEFPLVLVIYLIDCIKNNVYESATWDEQRAAKIITKTLPHILDKDDGKYWYSMEWTPVHFYNYSNIFDKVFARKFDYKIQLYLKNEYQLEGFTKEITNDTWNRETWITFQKREET
jgi:hypothetical protein